MSTVPAWSSIKNDNANKRFVLANLSTRARNLVEPSPESIVLSGCKSNDSIKSN
jgi:hypothetical protein